MTQKQKVLEYLKSGRSLTQLEALKLGMGLRLGDIIFRLRKEGHNIASVEHLEEYPADSFYGGRKKNKTHYGEYVMTFEPKEKQLSLL